MHIIYFQNMKIKKKNYKKEIDYLKKGHSFYFKYNEENFATKNKFGLIKYLR